MQNFIYRIKDLTTGKYYRSQDWTSDHISWKKVKPGYLYHYPEKNGSGVELVKYLYFDETGNLWPTKMGAEKIISGIVKCSIHDRKTPAGFLLKSKYNLVVVKSELKLKDIKDET